MLNLARGTGGVHIWLLSLLASSFAVGCDAMQTSRAICDEQVGDSWTHRSSAPANYQCTVMQEYFNLDPAFEITSRTFEEAELIWYGGDSGETVACVVFKGSDRVNAVFTLSADQSEVIPTEFRILGPT